MGASRGSFPKEMIHGSYGGLMNEGNRLPLGGIFVREN